MRLEQHDIVTLDEAESVDSLTKKNLVIYWLTRNSV